MSAIILSRDLLLTINACAPHDEQTKINIVSQAVEAYISSVKAPHFQRDSLFIQAQQDKASFNNAYSILKKLRTPPLNQSIPLAIQIFTNVDLSINPPDLSRIQLDPTMKEKIDNSERELSALRQECANTVIKQNENKEALGKLEAECKTVDRDLKDERKKNVKLQEKRDKLKTILEQNALLQKKLDDDLTKKNANLKEINKRLDGIEDQSWIIWLLKKIGVC